MVPPPPPYRKKDEDECEPLLEYLEQLAIEAREINGGPPVPKREPTEAEIELSSIYTHSSIRSEEPSQDLELEFEKDDGA